MSNGILVVAEQLRGEVSEITFEMLGLGRKLADDLKAPLTGAITGSDVAGAAAKLGLADKVLVVDNTQLAMPSASAAAGVASSATV